jgi:hypothetical protein
MLVFFPIYLRQKETIYGDCLLLFSFMAIVFSFFSHKKHVLVRVIHCGNYIPFFYFFRYKETIITGLLTSSTTSEDSIAGIANTSGADTFTRDFSEIRLPIFFPLCAVFS